MVEVTVQIPLTYNDGTPVKAQIFKGFEFLMVDEFGGFTKLPGTVDGKWKGENGRIYEDISYRYEVAIDENELDHMKSIIRNLGRILKQEAMYYKVDGKPDIMNI